MGARKPENIPLTERHHQGATVGLMIHHGWAVISVCRGCQLQMMVRLDWIARISGPHISLWNRRAPCRRLLCKGATEFHAMAPGMNRYEPMTIDDRLPDHDGWAKSRLRQVRKRKAAENPPDV